MQFELPDFTRVGWVSPEAKKWWGEKIAHCSRVWNEVEALSVVTGLRDSALLTISPWNMPRYERLAAKNDLRLLTLSAQAHTDGYSVSPRSGEDRAALRVALTRDYLAGDWIAAWDDGDDKEIGQLLETPDCCIQSFLDTWGEGQVDSTWEQVKHTHGIISPDNSTNVFLRWMGIRLVPYMPCSVDCETTRFAVKNYKDMMKSEGLENELADMRSVLRFPLQWSALHGIAVIMTPVFRIVTRTDYSPDERRIVFAGDVWPVFGGQSNTFPFNARSQCSMVADGHVGKQDLFWKENGFSSHDAMKACHDRLLEVLLDVVSPGDSVVDMGCGTGLLLQRLYRGMEKMISVSGIDSDSEKIQVAKKQSPYGNWLCANLNQFTGEMPEGSVVICSRERIRENAEIESLFGKARAVVLYDYPDTSPGSEMEIEVLGVDSDTQRVVLQSD